MGGLYFSAFLHLVAFVHSAVLWHLADRFADVVRLPSKIQIYAHEWKEIVTQNTHVWVDYI